MTGILCNLIGGTATSPTLDTQTVTRGTSTTGSNPTEYYSGYASGLFGSIADGTSNIYGGASILNLYFYEEAYVSPPVGVTTRQVVLIINGAQANSGWATMTVGTTPFTRASATFSVSTQTNWIWDIPITNPFVSEGDPFTASTTVIWT